MKTTKEVEPVWLALHTAKSVMVTWRKDMKAMNRVHLEKHPKETEVTQVENAGVADAVTTVAISVEDIVVIIVVTIAVTIVATSVVNTAAVAVNNAVESLIVSNSQVRIKKTATSNPIAGTTTNEDHSNAEIYL